ncbi:unnamed protein product [Lymnaea stagnalis]|uniref:E3 ubiquitin-protein ligase parkin n=1 Tax=Lymnaea stagnalis TaxID=6523 RepID=A0AAV2HFV7_LYMST
MATAASTSVLSKVLVNEPEQLSIVVRFSGNKIYNVNISSKDTISDLKKAVAHIANVSPRTLNLVLTGQLLNDSTLLQDCGLGIHTTLHAFCWSDNLVHESPDIPAQKPQLFQETDHKAPHGYNSRDESQGNQITRDCLRAAEETSTPAGESDVDGNDFIWLRTQREISSRTRPPSCYRNLNTNDISRFFVYCKICDCVQPAKLRLSCKDCGSGAFLVDRGPSNWRDISANTEIIGTCKSGSCSGTVPRFYLRCNEKHDGEVEGTAALLKHVQANHKRVECIICSDVMSHVLIFPCSPGHVICLECFNQYGTTCLNERRFVEHPVHGYTLPCPAGCLDSHIEETHHFLLLGQEKYERYKNFGAEEYVLQNGGMLCPGPGCGMGLFPSGEGRLVKCRECRHEFCKDCRREFHLGGCENFLESLSLAVSDLRINDERAVRATWEQEAQSLIDETTKSCPGCQTKTERSGGCMHMICSRCQTEWCWICVKKWNRDCMADHWFGT